MREHVLALVERHLNVPRLRFSGESNITLKCPFHKGGNESSASFSVNVDLGLFNCFTCHLSGTLPVLLKMLGLTPEQVDNETKNIKQEIDANRSRIALKKKGMWLKSEQDPFRAETILRQSILRAYELPPGVGPAPLVQAGFQDNWLRYLDVGVDRSTGRITYPIRDLYGNLAGIVGGATYSGMYPKYKVYEGRRKEHGSNREIPSDFGPWFDEEYPNYTFKNHSFLWNFDRVYPRLFWGKEADPTIIIVEGFKACMWLLQNGFWNTVAIMGSQMSEQQRNHLLRLNARVVLFLDNNGPGRDGAKKTGRKLVATHGVSFARYPDDADDECQPDNLSAVELTESITGAVNYPQYMNGENTWASIH